MVAQAATIRGQATVCACSQVQSGSSAIPVSKRWAKPTSSGFAPALAGIRCEVIPAEQLKVIRSALQQDQLTGIECFVREIEQITGLRIERAVQGYILRK